MIPRDQQERCRALVSEAAAGLLDPQGRDLAVRVQWWPLAGLPGEWPVAVLGEGPPLLLLHGFDSSFLEFRRLAVIEERHGDGGRSTDGSEGGVGLIGASMGGAVAVELARRRPRSINRLLLLAPAGLTGRPMPLPPLLDALGVRFLALPAVRRGLCRSAFADPDSDVGPPELEIASLHLQAPRWAEALAAFARSGGFAGCGASLPPQPLEVLWGAQDRILRPPQKRAVLALLGERVRELQNCGHLPHIDQPHTVAATWLRQPVTPS